jgi:F-type H+-transporting ATPase subunit delta
MTDLAKEYGTALFALAMEENAAKEYAAALDLVREALEQEPEYLTFLISPSIPVRERIAAIETAFAQQVPEQVLSYLSLLCEKGRMACFWDSVEAYRALLDASQRVSKAKVTSAAELTLEEKEKLKCKLEAMCQGSVEPEYFLDEALLGGLIVEIDGKILDGSLRHRLQEVKEVMNL